MSKKNPITTSTYLCNLFSIRINNADQKASPKKFPTNLSNCAVRDFKVNEKQSGNHTGQVPSNKTPAIGPKDSIPATERQWRPIFPPIEEPHFGVLNPEGDIALQERGDVRYHLADSNDDSDSDGVYDMNFNDPEDHLVRPLEIEESSFSEFFEESADRDRPQINLKHVIPFGHGLNRDSSHFNETIPLNPIGNNEPRRTETPNRSSKKSRTEPEKNSSHRDSVNSPVPDIDDIVPNHKPSIFQKSILKPSQTVRLPKQEVDLNSPSKKNVKFAADMGI